eukprot:CAMPEP_0119342390 /NCGR_PEP_ID=MMETSP1333-20130426/104602_1 /TAXON_ID=418940 /ORGANISM="Scyphosphaera apsteinii, Strain RCC1455" /LENGTH=451 /DNA_ID=CAMNT_0007354597 /DNA_START=53 /DNA_END=1408 /DNA_ORIENTATION=-
MTGTSAPRKVARSRRPTMETTTQVARFPVADLEGLLWYIAEQPPPAAAVEATKLALQGCGTWRLRNHGIFEEQFCQLRKAGQQFFDRPADHKWPYAVAWMERSRGWEMYPQHRQHHLATMAQGAIDYDAHAEPSALEGILCERFVCGPPSICNTPIARPFNPFYDSPYARVFYERNVWPEEGELRPCMECLYPQMEHIAKAALQCVAAALDVPHDVFDQLVSSSSAAHPNAPCRHHSRMQLNNYPSQLFGGSGSSQKRSRHGKQMPIRASRHFDTSLLTVLAREPRTEKLHSSPGRSGALEVRMSAQHDPHEEWRCVPAESGELTCFLGALISTLSGFTLQGTTHRVTNPACAWASDSRRMSLGFVLKPDYTAPAALPVTLPGYSALVAHAAETAQYEVPPIGLMGRIGWQSYMMQTKGISRVEAMATYKTWKAKALSELKGFYAANAGRH